MEAGDKFWGDELEGKGFKNQGRAFRSQSFYATPKDSSIGLGPLPLISGALALNPERAADLHSLEETDAVHEWMN